MTLALRLAAISRREPWEQGAAMRARRQCRGRTRYISSGSPAACVSFSSQFGASLRVNAARNPAGPNSVSTRVSALPRHTATRPIPLSSITVRACSAVPVNASSVNRLPAMLRLSTRTSHLLILAACTAIAACSDATGVGSTVARFGLTKREAQIARSLARRTSNWEIAEQLDISPHTMRHHVENIFAKLGAHSRRSIVVELE